MYGGFLTLDIYSATDLQENECIAEFWEELVGELYIIEKGCSKCILVEYPLIIVFSFFYLLNILLKQD